MCEHITWYKKLRTAKYDPTKLEISLYRVVQNAFWITGTGELYIKSVTDGRTDGQTELLLTITFSGIECTVYRPALKHSALTIRERHQPTKTLWWRH